MPQTVRYLVLYALTLAAVLFSGCASSAEITGNKKGTEVKVEVDH